MKTTLRFLAVLGFIPLIGNAIALMAISFGTYEKLNLVAIKWCMGVGSIIILMMMTTMLLYGLAENFAPTQKEMEKEIKDLQEDKKYYKTAIERLNTAIFELSEAKKKYENK